MCACLLLTAFPFSELPNLGGGVSPASQPVFRPQCPGQNQRAGGSLLSFHHSFFPGRGGRGNDPIRRGSGRPRMCFTAGRRPRNNSAGIAKGPEQGPLRERKKTKEALFPLREASGGGVFAG